MHDKRQRSPLLVVARSDYSGTSAIRFEYYPLTYQAATYEDGEWLRPEFKCDGRVNYWVVSYLAPFFGKNDLKTRIEFKSVYPAHSHIFSTKELLF